MLNRSEIQNRVIQLIKDTDVYPVTYSTQGLAILDETNPIRPVSVFCNEVSLSTGLDPRNMREVSRIITYWRYTVLVQYPKEVDLDLLIKALSDTHHLRHDTVFAFEGYEVEHPTTQSPENGTRVTINLTISDYRS